MSKSLFKMVIMGAAGSGKGTISSRIVRDFGLQHLSSGDILRSQIMQKTALGLKAQSHMASGGLVPDDVMVGLVGRALGSEGGMHSPTVGWLLDGFPRTLAQAQALHKLYKVDLVVSLDVPFDTIVERIEGRRVHPGSGRVYNTAFNPPKVEEEAVQKQLRAYYASLDLLESFKAEDMEETWQTIWEYMCGRVKPVKGFEGRLFH